MEDETSTPPSSNMASFLQELAVAINEIKPNVTLIISEPDLLFKNETTEQKEKRYALHEEQTTIINIDGSRVQSYAFWGN